MGEVYRRDFLARVRARPLAYAERTAIQALTYWWVPPRLWREHAFATALLRAAPVVLLNLLLVPGLLRLRAREPWLAAAILAFLVPFTLAYALTQISNTRFKLDVEWLTIPPAAMVLFPPRPSSG
jgi:hypothetical protein